MQRIEPERMDEILELIVDTVCSKRETITIASDDFPNEVVKSLVRQGQGVTNIEITDANIGSFEPKARKYGVDFALKKDCTETPPKWLVFF